MVEYKKGKAILTVARDITERKQAEEALKERAKELDCLYSVARDTQEDLSIEEVCRRALEHLVQGMQFPETAAVVIELNGKRFTSGNYTEDLSHALIAEIRVKGEAHGRLWVYYTGDRPFLVPEEQNLVDGIAETLGIWLERKRAQGALKESEEKYRILAEESPLAVSLIGEDGRYRYINPKFTEIFGYTLEDIATGRDWFRKAYPDKEYRGQVISTWLSDQKEYGIGEARPRKYTVTCKDGSKKSIEFRPVTLETGDQLVIYEDVTETERLEEQLRQSQRLESIGRLAGGVAHDFNNLLTTIMGNADMALMDLGKDEPLYKGMEEIKGAGQRAARLVRQLLAFSRKSILEPEVLYLNDVVREIHNMLVRLIGEDIELETVLAPNLGLVEADPGQVEQVIMNLAVNARDAMPEGGKLTLETANVELDETYANRHGRVVTPGPYVMLAVSDTGTGMSPETQAQVFDPFFTTKELGEGTGLGLSTVYGIVKQSSGYIWVYSESGKGTTFKVYLPRVEKATFEPQEAKREPEDLRGSETVLVVEDEESVRDIARKILSQSGYTVLEASDGQEALNVFREHEGEVHLLLADLVMPGMSGKEVAEELKEEQPSLKVLYMSGYTDNAIARKGVLKEGTHFIQKPFTPDGLASKVRDVLNL